MGKHEAGTPKAIANRIKAKGLQKLRWYCQMCEKQCRDENGFKCHMMSESHQRQMQLFQENPNRFVDGYSKQFKDEFLRLLHHRFHTTRVYANMVYNEYIHDRHHVHMNATIWQTLSDFVKYLGRESLCKVDETPKGWYIAYIDRDPETLARMEAEKRKERMELDDAERAERALKTQIEKGLQEGAPAPEGPSEEAARELFAKEFGSSDATIQIALTTKSAKAKRVAVSTPLDDEEEHTAEKPQQTTSTSSSSAPAPSSTPTPTSSSAPTTAKSIAALNVKLPSKVSSQSTAQTTNSASSSSTKKRKAHDVLESLMEQSKRDSLHTNYTKTHSAKGSKANDAWLMEGIVVKVMANVGQGKYYKQKGVVEKVVDSFVGEVSMLEFKGVIRVDQDDLETVIPAIGGTVIFVKGPFRGTKAQVQSLEIDDFTCTVKLHQGNAVVVKGVAYEDVCKTKE